MRELSLHILDVMENSIEAGASRILLSIEEDCEADTLTITIEDNGRGMSEDLAKQVLDPFTTTRVSRRVGLGLPLFAAAAERCCGRFCLESQANVGTTVCAVFQYSHVDRAPLGDMIGTLMAVLLSERPVDVRYRHTVGDRSFILDSGEVHRELELVPFSHPLVRQWLESTLAEGLAGVGSREIRSHLVGASAD